MDAAVLDGVVAAPAATHQVAIDFMYLDLETCTRCCRGTDANLEAALAEVGRVLDAAGEDVSVRKTLVASAEQARALGFVSSPTIRVNGTDIALELRVAALSAARPALAMAPLTAEVWVWQGQEHTEAPTSMIVDAILRGIYGGGERAIAPLPVGAVPENLARFFAGKERLARLRVAAASRAGRVLRAVGEGLLLRRRELWELRVPVGERRKVG